MESQDELGEWLLFQGLLDGVVDVASFVAVPVGGGDCVAVAAAVGGYCCSGEETGDNCYCC